MVKHVQRKRFKDLAVANATQTGFEDPSHAANFTNISTEIIEDEDGIWLFVTQQGDEITGNEPLLPEYELVV